MEALLAARWAAAGCSSCFPPGARGVAPPPAPTGVHFLRVAGLANPTVPWRVIRSPTSVSPSQSASLSAGESEEEANEEASNAAVAGFLLEEEKPTQARTVALCEEAGPNDGQISSAQVVRVKFKLHQSCRFGEQFFLVGEDSRLGSWSPDGAIPLDWSEGDVWTAETVISARPTHPSCVSRRSSLSSLQDLPPGKEIQFKFILREPAGGIRWQPGPDRVLQTWHTANTIVVTHDWDKLETEEISEEEVEPDAGDAAVEVAERQKGDGDEEDEDEKDDEDDDDKRTGEDIMAGEGRVEEAEEEAVEQDDEEEDEEEKERAGWVSSVLENDIRWGRETLEKIFSSLGFFQQESV